MREQIAAPGGLPTQVAQVSRVDGQHHQVSLAGHRAHSAALAKLFDSTCAVTVIPVVIDINVSVGRLSRAGEASFKLICTTSAMTAPKHQRGYLNLVKRGHYDFALSVETYIFDMYV